MNSIDSKESEGPHTLKVSRYLKGIRARAGKLDYSNLNTKSIGSKNELKSGSTKQVDTINIRGEDEVDMNEISKIDDEKAHLNSETHDRSKETDFNYL